MQVRFSFSQFKQTLSIPLFGKRLKNIVQSPRYSWRMAFFSEHSRGIASFNRQHIIIIFIVYNYDKVGGLHLREPSPLPDNLQQLLDKSSQVFDSPWHKYLLTWFCLSFIVTGAFIIIIRGWSWFPLAQHCPLAPWGLRGGICLSGFSRFQDFYYKRMTRCKIIVCAIFNILSSHYSFAHCFYFLGP